ncbi:MAG: glycosyltransferase family 4 protein [Chitinispirillaceae bacterium]|nr:glycosyltransferase family 4 protein [Chitinispirillaceae bacterium]
MKIAFFSKDLPSDKPNGVSVQVHRLAEELCNLGHSVTVYTFSPSIKNSVYKCITVPSKKSNVFLDKFTPAIVFSKIDISSYDIAHYHGDDYLVKGSYKRIRTFYGSALMEAIYARSFLRFCRQMLFYLFELISMCKKGKKIAISSPTCRYLPFVNEVIPCGVPLDRYFPKGLKTPYPSILFVGNLNSRKRGDLLLDIFQKEVLPIIPNCILNVIGNFPCKGKNVNYIGKLPEDLLIKEYQKNWVLCSPSSYEGFGVPIIEAMACGTVVVATENAGSKTIITNGEDGILCKPHSLGKVLIEILTNEQKRKSLIKLALQKVKRYDIKTIAQTYEKIYREISYPPLH